VPSVPNFAAVGAIRCWHRVLSDVPAACGADARWIRATPASLAYGFFCDAHRAPDDRPLAGELVLRRVSLALEVIFAGTSLSPTFAQTDALAALERGVEAVGGYVNLHAARSVVGRFTLPPGGGAGRGERGRG
jgi:hypothetical protein